MSLFQKSVEKKYFSNLDAAIEKPGKETNRMIYELYGLTEEEAKIIEQP